MIRFAWGEPKSCGELRFKTGTLLSKDQETGRDHWVTHPMRRWYGVTLGDSIFIGVAIFHRRREGYAPIVSRSEPKP